jgi:hypothetical protein
MILMDVHSIPLGHLTRCNSLVILEQEIFWKETTKFFHLDHCCYAEKVCVSASGPWIIMQGKALATIPSSIQAIRGGVLWPCCWNGGFLFFGVVLVDLSKLANQQQL